MISNKKQIIVSVSGKKRAGKDVLASKLISDFGFKRISFADPLKTIASKEFNIDLKYFYDDNLKDKNFDVPFKVDTLHLERFFRSVAQQAGIDLNKAEKVDFKPLERYCVSPRVLLQYLGADIIRNNLGESAWIDILERSLSSLGDRLVIADSRFSNERAVLKGKGAILVKVNRDSLDSCDTHVSENDLGEDSDYDMIISNDSNLATYLENIELWAEAKFGRK